MATHPWGHFLYARALALRWLRDELGKSPEETVRELAMDPGQVSLILATPLDDIRNVPGTGHEDRQLPPVQAIHDLAAARLRSLLATGDTGAVIDGNVVRDLTEIKRIAETLGAEDTHGG